MSGEITCDVDGCSKKSQYLLTCGERCAEHAHRDQPETAEFLDWGKAVLGDTDE